MPLKRSFLNVFGSNRAPSSLYALLPSSSSSSSLGSSPPSTHKELPPFSYTRRCRSLRFCIFCAPRHHRSLYLLVLVVVTAAFGVATYVLNYPLPPLYERYHAAERLLPQHNVSLPLPEGRDGRYLWISNHASKCGWGNYMQELFLNAYLAYQSDRSFVFDNYTWSHQESEHSLYNLKPIPSRIPLTALIAGPIAGGQFPPSINSPRAVTPNYFYEVCKDRALIGSYDLDREYVSRASAKGLMKAWTEKMAPHRCVEIVMSPPELFNEHLFADAHRLLDIWPDFSQSPIVQSFVWSTLVEIAFDNNRHIISPTSPYEAPLTASRSQGLARYTRIPGLLVLHIRRGDFQSHCFDVLERRSIGFTGFNSFPALPDRWALSTDFSKHDQYSEHCFPDIDAIADRVEEVRRAEGAAAHTLLDKVYIMTNGSPRWVRRLTEALHARYAWAHIASSRDLVLTPEQKHVSQALDMLVAQRAQVFVGNGFSTLSGMAVMLRMANGVPPETTRHW